MNKTHRTLSLIILSSTLILSATEGLQQDTPQAVSFYTQTTTNAQQAWQNKWVKVGTVSTACALVYAVGVRLNIVPAPSVPTLSLLAVPFIAKKTMTAQDLSQNEDSAVGTTKNTQQEATTTEEIVIPSNNEQSTENNTVILKKNIFPNKNDLREATDAFKKWLIKGVHNYTPGDQQDYQ